MKKKLFKSFALSVAGCMLLSMNISATEPTKEIKEIKCLAECRLRPEEKKLIINMLHKGNSKLEEIKKVLAGIPDDDYESLNKFAQELFKNKEIEIVHNPRLAKRWIEEWFKVCTVFPILKGRVSLVGCSDSHPKGFSDCLAETDPSVLPKVIWYKNLENDQICKRIENSGLYVSVTTSEYTMVHELGHCLVFVLVFTSNGRCQFEEFLKIPEDAYNNIQGPKESLSGEIGKISSYQFRYSSDEAVLYLETISEALADISIHGEGAAPLSKEIVFKLFEKYKKFFL